MTWYIENNGEAKLIPEEVLKYKIENDEVSGDTLVVNEEIGNWIPLKETQFWKQIRQGRVDTPCQKQNITSSSSTPNTNPPQGQQKKQVNWGALIFVIVSIISVVWYFNFYGVYYVAKLPDYPAATVKVDGYMHKDKSCCQKIADSFGATVISIKPNDNAGKNSYGQTLHYDDCFHYCSLCCY